MHSPLGVGSLPETALERFVVWFHFSPGASINAAADSIHR
jgi:hypothetical protein